VPDQENPVSWDLFYLTKEGMEAHLQLKGATVEEVLSQAGTALGKVQKAGGVARPRRGGNAETSAPDDPPKCGTCGKVMTFREGTSKNGRDYKGYFCPDRDCEGEPVWVND
jgi:hypothetical protein